MKQTDKAILIEYINAADNEDFEWVEKHSDDEINIEGLDANNVHDLLYISTDELKLIIDKENATKKRNTKRIWIIAISAIIILATIIFSFAMCSRESEKTYSGAMSLTVYITSTGTKYHKNNCDYLKNSKIEIKKGKAIDEGYTPCSKCKP